MKKYINLLLIVEAIICILVCVLGGRDLNFTSELLAFPFKAMAIGLRELSFLGGIANIFAWVIFTLVCSVPIIILVARIIKKRFAVEDSLLAVISLIMTLSLYQMININTMISEIIVPIEDLGVMYCVLGAMAYSIIAAYVIIKIVRKFAKANKEKLKIYFNNVLFMVNVIVILASLGFSLNENNYTLRKEDFERIFPNEVKEFINEYSNKKSSKTEQEEQQEETIYEEDYEEEYEQ
jgi:glucan phosphoethanolaminetransferase (alkaline phosphatase superfamily)